MDSQASVAPRVDLTECPVWPDHGRMPMRGRIPADEEAWLYHKLKTEVDMDSLLQETLPPPPPPVQLRMGWTHTRLWD